MKEGKALQIQGLIYVHDSQPGIQRKRHGRGFIYLDERQKKIKDDKIIQRIKNLKIPPAWERVWICKSPNGYILATGFDNKERKQYVYHPGWSEWSQHEKFRKLYEFGKALPALRKKIDANLHQPDWSREKLLSLVLKFMDEKRLRVGNKLYEEENETYGITTLRRKHLTETANKLTFEFKGKSGKYRKIEVVDPEMIALIKESSELPGYEIFRYMDEEGRSRAVDSSDVNEFLGELTGRDFTSKTFRTWGGTVLAMEKWEAAKEEAAADSRKSLKSAIVNKVAEELGNTSSIAEKYYIHPAVLEKISSDDFVYKPPRKADFTANEKKFMEVEELAVLRLLEEEAE